MKTFYLYIIYSEILDKYCIGSTGDNLDERLRRHNSNHSGYTGKSNAWNIVYFEEYSSREEAYGKERKIKSWKLRKMIEDLISNFKK
ncbi:GIY-YIG nuclease family protein [Bacteroidales bacterium OttesenSCG-928-I21]|nr:GIY-YIG nuclease family protein [Bacteroidales bacterium OttesenSCG-928-I21]